MSADDDLSPDRTPPQNIDAERVALGAMMFDQKAIGVVAEILTGVNDFYAPKHATIYRTILDLAARGEPTDPIAVVTRLTEDGEIGRAGGAEYLHSLVEHTPLAANAGYYAALVAKAAGFRRLSEAAALIARIAHTGGGTLPDAQDRAGQALMAAIGMGSKRQDIARYGELVDQMLEDIRASATRDGLRGLSTGWSDLDRLTGGMEPGHLWIVAARPGMGKTVAAADIARSVAVKQNRPVLFFTLEMSKADLMLRFTAAEASVPLHRLRSGQLDDADWDRVHRTTRRLRDVPLYLGDGFETNAMHVRATARRVAAEHGDLGLIIVDYLQLMPAIERKGNGSREREVAELSRSLKALAKELEAPVLALSQLNRGNEQRTNKRPQLSDLRESGAIEQDADTVIMIHRDDYYDTEHERAGEADLIIEKSRHSNKDTVVVAAQLHYSRFADIDAGVTG